MDGQTDIDRVRDATDLVGLIGEHVSLRQKGREHVCVCPFHDDHSPSMTVVTHKSHAFYKCFACGASGDAFTFVMEYHKKDFPDALRFLADRAGIALTESHEFTNGAPGAARSDLRRATTWASTFFQRSLADETTGAEARSILAVRGITPTTAETFGIGLAPAGWDNLTRKLQAKADALVAAEAVGLIKPRDNGQGHYDALRNRIIFPIVDEVGVPIAFGGRVIDPADEPKYLNSPESSIFNKSKTLYGFYQARTAIEAEGQAIVTEGYTDVIACHQAGITNVVGTLGTAITAEHTRKLSRFCDRVVLLFDGDEAGQKAADRAIRVFFSAPVDVTVCVLPDGKDPDELLREPGGRAAFDTAIAEAIDALTYTCQRFQQRLAGVDSLAGRQKVLDAFLAELADLGFGNLQGVRRPHVLSRLSTLTGLSTEALNRELSKKKRPSRSKPAVRRDVQARTIQSPRSTNDASQNPRENASENERADGALMHMTRARRLAEHTLLSLVIHEPELADASVNGRTMRERLNPAEFLDDASRSIARCICLRLNNSQSFTVQDLHRELSEDQARRVASDLYFEGERLTKTSDTSLPELLQDAVASLESHVERNRYEDRVRSARSIDPTKVGMDTLQELLELRRQQDAFPAAIPQGVRG